MISAELPVKISFILLAGVAGSHESDGPRNQSQSNSTGQGAADVGDRRHVVALEILGILEGQCLSSACELIVWSTPQILWSTPQEGLLYQLTELSTLRFFFVVACLQFFLSPHRTKLNCHLSQHQHGNGSDRFSKRMQVIFSVQRHGTFVIDEDP